MEEVKGLAGFHESEDGYIVSFPDDEADRAVKCKIETQMR